MIDNKVEGEIKVKCFVDTLGVVKKVEVLNDLGYGSADAAKEAAFQMNLGPATYGEKKIPVWVIIPIQFKLRK